MSIVKLNEIPDVIEDIILGKKKVIAYDRPLTDLTRYALRYEYNLLTQELEEDLEVSCLPGWKPLTTLRHESPDKSVIVACSDSMEEVWKKVAPYGNFPVINYFMPDYIYPFLPALRDLPITYKREEKRSTGRKGIIIRGQLVGDLSFQAVQKIAFDHPYDYIIVSTWNTISEEEKVRYEEICDCLILNEQPPLAGIQNRNFQITCIQSAVRAALKAGVEKILVTRSDCLFTNRFMLDSFDALLNAFPSEVALSFGQKGRLIIPDFATRYYIPYHVGDMFTYGWAEDVARYWLSVPYDPRTIPESMYKRIHPVNIKEIGRLGLVVETFFAMSFMDAIGKQPQGTLEDSLSFYRDFFITVSNYETGMFWFRSFWYNRTIYMGRFSKLLTHQMWLELASGKDISRYVDLDIEKTTWGDFTRD
jgi:hypothetical protein